MKKEGVGRFPILFDRTQLYSANSLLHIQYMGVVRAADQNTWEFEYSYTSWRYSLWYLLYTVRNFRIPRGLFNSANIFELWPRAHTSAVPPPPFPQHQQFLAAIYTINKPATTLSSIYDWDLEHYFGTGVLKCCHLYTLFLLYKPQAAPGPHLREAGHLAQKGAPLFLERRGGGGGGPARRPPARRRHVRPLAGGGAWERGPVPRCYAPLSVTENTIILSSRALHMDKGQSLALFSL